MAARLLAWAVLVTLAIVASGCGGGNGNEDPFPGTWKSEDGGVELVIAKTPDGYRVALFREESPTGWLLYARHGNELRGRFDVFARGKPTGQTIEVVIAFHPDSGHLVFTEGEGGPGFQFSKVGTSTTMPTGSPSNR